MPTSTLEASVVRISDRVAYLNSDIDDALRSGIVQELPPNLQAYGLTHGRRIGAMVTDIIENSSDIRAIRISPALLAFMNELKDWLFENVYLRYPVLFPDVKKAQGLVRDLFAHYLKEGTPTGERDVQSAVDYVAGMTDRFAIET